MSDKRNYDKYKHLIGTKINEWTILDVICDPNRTNTYLSVQCSCGTVTELKVTEVTKNIKLDCGCMHRKRLNEKTIKKYEYLINTTINGWTILDIVPPSEECRKTRALCRCRCGTIKKVKLQFLLNGRSKDCGCGRKNTLREIFTNDLVGQRFGKLVAVEMLKKRNKNGRIVYRCKCDCGNEVNVLGNSLVTYHTLSCGCLVSYYNMHIKQLLERKEIDFKSEYTIYIDDKYYRFDFYLPQYNLFIEYDGQQHFEPVRFHGNNIEENEHAFRITQEHDKIKNNYCEEHNINLLRIPYWEKDNIETIIDNHLQRLSEKGYIAKAI